MPATHSKTKTKQAKSKNKSNNARGQPKQPRNKAMPDSSVETMLSLIEEETGLWKVSSDEYKTQDHDALWERIARLMKMDCNKVRNKWKNLKRDYTKAVREEPEITSGAAATDYQPTFKWYNRMKFLHDEIVPRDSTSNLDKAIKDVEEGAGSDEDAASRSGSSDGFESSDDSNDGEPPNNMSNSTTGEDLEHYFKAMLPLLHHLNDVENWLFRGQFTEIILQLAYNESGAYAKEFKELLNGLNK